MDESQIDNDLNHLSNDSAKLLYLINYIYEKGKIDQKQKRKLKEYVCQEKELVFNLLINRICKTDGCLGRYYRRSNQKYCT